MKLALLSVLIAMFGVFAPQAAPAQEFPAKPVRLVVPFPPGGIADALARILGEGLSKNFNQQVIIENRPGAGETSQRRRSPLPRRMAMRSFSA